MQYFKNIVLDKLIIQFVQNTSLASSTLKHYQKIPQNSSAAMRTFSRKNLHYSQILYINVSLERCRATRVHPSTCLLAYRSLNKQSSAEYEVHWVFMRVCGWWAIADLYVLAARNLTASVNPALSSASPERRRVSRRLHKNKTNIWHREVNWFSSFHCVKF